MSYIDFDNSLKNVFIIIHIATLAITGFYIATKEITTALAFLNTSVIALLYYIMFTENAIQRRIQAHLNLIDKAVNESKEFKEKVTKKKQGANTETKTNKQKITDKLTEKNVSETISFVEEQLEEENLSGAETEQEFIKKVIKIEESNQNRKSVVNQLNKKIVEEYI